MRTHPGPVLLALLGVACGIPREKYQAAVSEAARNMRSADDQCTRAEAAEGRARAETSEKRVAELTEQLAELEKAAAAASADASRQRDLVAQLAKSRECSNDTPDGRAENPQRVDGHDDAAVVAAAS